ncbi:30S ribosomal protein S18 [Oopsacas minuta]|uniref:30S ribosomal protein S18 n=1 Tax=Oopsacas minuta TaxID=111878 RepID=A0AAV7KKH5_9METZ|nr:30S ribosomal protein S18 [Oopsacas minuta]
MLLTGIRSLTKHTLSLPRISAQRRWKFDPNEKRGMPQIFNREPIDCADPIKLVREKITGIYEEDGNVFKRPGCQLCWRGLDEFTYRDVLLISQFITSTGRIIDRHESGICKKMQAKLREEVKKARNIGLIPKALTPQQIELLNENDSQIV